MLKYQEGIYIRGYNTLASVDILSDNIIYPEHMLETNDWMFDKNVRGDFILDWHNDTAFLKNYYEMVPQAIKKYEVLQITPQRLKEVLTKVMEDENSRDEGRSGAWYIGKIQLSGSQREY